jgi:hypothetical protein
MGIIKGEKPDFMPGFGRVSRALLPSGPKRPGPMARIAPWHPCTFDIFPTLSLVRRERKPKEDKETESTAI